MDGDLRAVAERELALLEPDVRRDPKRVRAHLHPDFVEYGASGRVWDRTSAPTATAEAAGPIEAVELRARRLGPDAVLLTYRTRTPGRTALRCSTWIRDAGGPWLMLFHQGTPTPQASPGGSP
jgi:hypothetical protein